MDLIFWLITPPNNIKEIINELPAHWKHGEVIVVSCHDVREERKKTGYTSECENIRKMYILDNMEDPNGFVEEFLSKHREDIHVFGGLRKEPAPIMYRFKRKFGPNVRIAAFTEKPAVHSGSRTKQLTKQLLYKLIYGYIYKRAMNTVDLMFVVSESGIQAIREAGWKKDNLYAFMYCDNSTAKTLSTLEVTNRPVRFLYIGRFNYHMRGLDVLMEAFDSLQEQDWELCLVGGYGEDKDEVIAWAQEKEKVTFGGTWPADQVMDNMSNFDVYICPCKEDSWNGQINMALSAGMGVITTDEAGSHELVNASGAGFVIKKEDPAALRECMEAVIRDREMLLSWKQSAAKYADRITAKTVAKYFCDILEGNFMHGDPAVACPWLENNQN